MRVEKGMMIPLGYGKHFRSESIVGLEPIEDGRGPGTRTRVYVEDLGEAVVASRSEASILRDMVHMPKEVTRAREQQLLLADILDAVAGINPMIRAIVHDQGKWDLDRLEERLREVLADDEA